MGERLNSPRPKLCLESNVLTGQSFLSLYFSYFRAIETLYHCTVPVAIMTSRATNDPLVLGLYIMNRIKKELEENQYYGLNPNSVTLMPPNRGSLCDRLQWNPCYQRRWSLTIETTWSWRHPYTSVPVWIAATVETNQQAPYHFHAGYKHSSNVWFCLSSRSLR